MDEEFDARCAGKHPSHITALSFLLILFRVLYRRELAAREHIVAHEPGKGQQAFAPNRRDMNAYRAELEKRRLDQLHKESVEGRESTEPEPIDPRAIPSLSAPAPAPTPQVQPPAPSNPLAALRISQPLGGLRQAVPRPQPMSRPQPISKPSPSSSTVQPEAPPIPSTPDTASQPPLAPAETTPLTAVHPAESEPLLSSHLCSSYFVEPLSWMSSTLETGVLAGKITCPNLKCGAKLGNFDWAGNRTFATVLQLFHEM